MITAPPQSQIQRSLLPSRQILVGEAEVNFTYDGLRPFTCIGWIGDIVRISHGFRSLQ